MKMKRRIMVSSAALACSACLALGFGFVSSANETETETTMASTVYLNVRDAANTNGNILGVLSPNESVAVTGITDGWYNVVYNGQAAYAYQEFLNFEGSSADGDVENGKETDMISTVYLNVRSNPNTSSTILDVLSPQQKVQVTGKTNGWYKVKHNGHAGFVYADFLDFIRAGSEQPTETEFQELSMTTNMGINFRSGPSTNDSIIGSFAKGTILTVIGTENDWFKVDYNGKKGYVYSQYMSEGAMTYENEGAVLTVIAPNGANLRTNSTMDARVMSVVPHGAQVVVVDYENGWYRVNYNEDYGCIKAELLQ